MSNWFAAMGDDQFEQLCRDVAEILYGTTYIKFGVRGERQHGIDAYSSDKNKPVLQITMRKEKDKLRNKIIDDINKYKKFRTTNDSTSKSIVFMLASNSSYIQTMVEKIIEDYNNETIEVSFVYGDSIFQTCKSNNRLFKKYFFQDAPVYSLEFNDTEDFFPRKEIIDKIRAGFTMNEEYSNQRFPVKVLTLWGQTGVGKSRLAIQYAKTRSNDFSHIIRINTDSRQAFRAYFSKIAKLMRISACDTEDNTITEVVRVLNETRNYLLIIESVDTDDYITEVAKVLRDLHDGSVILTSQRGVCSDFSKLIPVGSFEDDETKKFILQSTKDCRRLVDDDECYAEKLAQEFKGLVAMLTLAKHYICRVRCSIAEYYKDWSNTMQSFYSYNGDHKSLNATVKQSMNRLNDASRKSLYCLAWLSSSSIPTKLFLSVLIHNYPNKCDFNKTAMIKSSINDFFANSTSLSQGEIHKLIQESIINIMNDSEKTTSFQIMSQIMLEVHSSNIYQDFEISEKLSFQLHLETIIRKYEMRSVFLPEIFSKLQSLHHLLINNVADYNQNKENYYKILRSLAMDNKTESLENAYRLCLAAESLSNKCSYRTGSSNSDLKKAADLTAKAVKIYEKICKNTDSRLIRARRQLAFIYGLQNKYEKAHNIYIEILSNNLDLMKNDRATTMRYLVELLQRKAKSMVEEMQILGVKQSLKTHEIQSLFIQAEKYSQIILDINEQIYESPHELIALSKYHLAICKGDLNKSAECKNLACESHEMFLKLLGPQHSDTKRAKKLLDVTNQECMT